MAPVCYRRWSIDRARSIPTIDKGLFWRKMDWLEILPCSSHDIALPAPFIANQHLIQCNNVLMMARLQNSNLSQSGDLHAFILIHRTQSFQRHKLIGFGITRAVCNEISFMTVDDGIEHQIQTYTRHHKLLRQCDSIFQTQILVGCSEAKINVDISKLNLLVW